jgi:UDP-GlcNAc:undecaprenyl-phosphate GlcNAc-1-phosphate transferase
MPDNLAQLIGSPLFAGALTVLLGFTVVALLVPAIIRLAPRLDKRGGREFHQTHKHPVPRLGGLAIAAAFLIIAPLALILLADDTEKFTPRLAVTVTALLMFVLGFWDDLSPLGARKKLLGQVLVATLAYFWGLKIDRFHNPFAGHDFMLGWMALPATVLWLVALTNLINLIDGIDGLAGGVALMLMSLLAYVGLPAHLYSFFVAAGMIGALLAFLKFNFPPARIYMGDGGAYFLGYLIGALTIQNSNKGAVAAALVAPVVALALPILDVAFSIIRRGLKGLPIFRPDRRHIHHRLLQSGHSRRRAVLTLYGISLMFLVMAFVAFWNRGLLIPILFGSVFLVLLVVAPSLGLIRNWLTVGTAVGNSIEMRREVQYALLLRNWLELEAERCGSVEELWGDLQFIARKLQFTTLTLRDGEVVRHWNAGVETCLMIHRARHEIHVEQRTVIIDATADERMSEQQFAVLSELVAEAWMQASKRWVKAHSEPFALRQAGGVATDPSGGRALGGSLPA